MFHLLRITKLTNPIIARGLRNRPLLGLTSKLMGISSYLSDVHIFLIAGQHREIILIVKGRVDHFLIVS